MYMNDAIGGGLSVDLMDYLLRDSYFTGVEYGKVDVSRIINSFEVVKNNLAIGQAALFAFEALMIARYQMFRAVYFHRTVRAAELMIIRSMILADKALNLTDLSLNNYLSLTDEVTLDRIATLNQGTDPELALSRKLAIDYMKRKLLKCAYEKTVQRKDRFLASIFNERSFREQFQNRIAVSAKVDPAEVYLDVPTAPSIPVSSSRESFAGITLVGRREGKKLTPYVMGIDDLPLIGTIAGYLDVVRVYTTEKSRMDVELAAGRVFGREGFETKVSM
ncbi:MAG: HD domain-containing protein, partial [Nitrososphaerales archaeon]